METNEKKEIVNYIDFEVEGKSERLYIEILLTDPSTKITYGLVYLESDQENLIPIKLVDDGAILLNEETDLEEIALVEEMYEHFCQDNKIY